MKYTATQKSPEIENLLTSFMGRSRKECIEAEQPICIICDQPVTGFKDDMSLKEYRITGMCQECQDQIFSMTSGV